MKEFYEFASNNPWLTGFLFLVVADTFVDIVKALVVLVK